ncbi:hypothetical protein [Streptomyces hydrogenans]
MRDVLSNAGDIGVLISLPLGAWAIYKLRRENQRLNALLRESSSDRSD